MMTTNVKDYDVENNAEELRKFFRDTMEDQFEHNIYSKSFSNQLESDDDEVDTLQKGIKWWMALIDRGGLIPNNFYDYSFDDLYVLYCKATKS